MPTSLDQILEKLSQNKEEEAVKLLATMPYQDLLALQKTVKEHHQLELDKRGQKEREFVHQSKLNLYQHNIVILSSFGTHSGELETLVQAKELIADEMKVVETILPKLKELNKKDFIKWFQAQIISEKDVKRLKEVYSDFLFSETSMAPDKIILLGEQIKLLEKTMSKAKKSAPLQPPPPKTKERAYFYDQYSQISAKSTPTGLTTLLLQSINKFKKLFRLQFTSRAKAKEEISTIIKSLIASAKTEESKKELRDNFSALSVKEKKAITAFASPELKRLLDVKPELEKPTGLFSRFRK